MTNQTLRIKLWRKLNNILVARIRKYWTNRLVLFVQAKYTKAFYDANPPELPER